MFSSTSGNNTRFRLFAPPVFCADGAENPKLRVRNPFLKLRVGKKDAPSFGAIYKADLEEFGRVAFETAPFETGESPATRMEWWPMVADALPAVGVFS